MSRPSAGALELVGFHRGKIGSDGSAITLGLSADTRRYAKGKGSIRLRAGDWSGAYNYRLDGDLFSGDLKIEPKEVLDPLKIDRSKLGFLAWLNDAGDREYVAVQLSSNTSSLVAVAVSPIPLRLVHATLVDRDTSKTLQKDITLTDVRERTPIIIPIDGGTATKSAVLKIVAWDYYHDDPINGPVLNLLIPESL